jgi:spermidine synthase
MALHAFGDTFKNVLVLGAGSGTDVAAALAHGAQHVDAVEIDPAIIRVGRAGIRIGRTTIRA